jgi:hypothetical protein
LASLSVAPIRSVDAGRFDAELDEHHWLGHRMVGETLRYAARDACGEWVALIGFASPALSCGPRDRFIGWSQDLGGQHMNRSLILGGSAVIVP